MRKVSLLIVFALLISILFVQNVFADEMVDEWVKTIDEIVKIDNRDKIIEYLTDKDMQYTCKTVLNPDKLSEYECRKEFQNKRETFVFDMIFDNFRRISEIKADCLYANPIQQNELSSLYLKTVEDFEKTDIKKDRHLSNDIYEYIKDETGYRAYDIKDLTYILTLNSDPTKDPQHLRYTIVRDIAKKGTLPTATPPLRPSGSGTRSGGSGSSSSGASGSGDSGSGGSHS